MLSSVVFLKKTAPRLHPDLARKFLIRSGFAPRVIIVTLQLQRPILHTKGNPLWNPHLHGQLKPYAS
jgi:hypothetical protein